MARRYRGLVRIKTRKAVRNINRIGRTFLGNNIDSTASTICCKTCRNIPLIDFDIGNLINRNIVKAQVALRFNRDTVHEHLDILAFHAANVDLAFAAHAARLAHLHTRGRIDRLRDRLAGILHFGSINRRNRLHFFRLFRLFRFYFRIHREFI